MTDTLRRPGRPPLHGQAMTPAERKREQRNREDIKRAAIEAEARHEQERRRERIAEVQSTAADALYALCLSYLQQGDTEGRSIMVNLCRELRSRNLIS